MRKGPGANIQRLLDELDPVKLSQRKRLELEEWAEFVEKNPEVELSQKAWVDIKRLDKTPLADLTMAQLENVRDYILHQFHVSRSINKIITKRREYETDVAARGAVDLMPPPPKNTLLKTLPPRKYERKKFKERISYIFGLGQEGYDLMIESLGGKESPAWDILADNLFESRNAELRIVDTALTKYGKAADAIYKKHKIRRPSKWLWEEVKTGPHTFVRAERVSLYRHTLNEDNLIAILEGGYAKRFAENPFALKGMEMDELKAIIDDLSPAEKALAEGPMTDFFNYFGKKMAVVFYEKNGYPMILIEPGKYYPKHVVPTSRTTALDAEKDNAVEKFRDTGFTRIGVDRSNTIDRVGSKKPIYINPFWYDMVRFAQRNATYITYEMPLTAASRLMNHPLFKNDMLTKYPPNLYAEIHKGLRDIAGRYMNYDLFEESVMRLKNNLSVAVLGGLNFRVMLRQTLSAPLYLLYVRPHHWVRGYIESIFNPRRVKQAHLENSPKYKERVESGFSRDLHDVFRDKNWKKILGKRHMSKKDAYMVGIRGMDKVAVKPGMQAAVTDVLAQIRRGKFNRRVKYHLQVDDSVIPKLDAGEKLGLAYKYADTATAEAQPMFLPEYWSALQRGGPGTKLFTMFGSFTNRALGQLKRSYRRFKGAKTAADRAYWGHQWIKTVFMLTVVNSFLLTFTDYLWHRFAGRDPEKFNWWIRMISAPAGFWFFIRDFVFSLQTHVEGGGFQGLDPSIPLTHWASQGVDGLYSGLAAATTDDPDLAKKHTKRALDRTAEFLLHMRGIPYGPTKRTIMSITKERE